jgi:radical SAM superfamily enzyme YgiQ (UPF0313 family)
MTPSDSHDFSQWYDRTYPDLTGHGLWLRGNEGNTLDPEEYKSRPYRILIARLSTYFDTAESFSHKILYRIAARLGTVFPDISYLPPLHDGPLFTRDKIPWLLGTGTKRGPRDFDVIAFSNAIVQEIVNVPVMLGKSGIPLKKSERLEDASVPLIILGGSNALYTSVFFTPDPLLDGIFFGESTDCIARIFSLCADAKARGLSKADTLTMLESVPGFIQPDKPHATKRPVDRTPVLNELLEDAPVFNLEDQYGRGNLQISEGCPYVCNFCAESFCRKPYREVAADRVIASAHAMKAGMGLDKIELYSFNFNTHSEFYRILDCLANLFPSVGLKSQRFDMLARDPDMLACCIAVGKTSITCGLEGISPRLRTFLNKNLTEPDLRTSLTRILSSPPIRELKIFLIATGLENRNDFEAFGEFIRFIKDCLLSANVPRSPRIIFSATPLVRFPWTPMEFEDAPQPETLKPIMAAIRNMVEAGGFEFRLSSEINDYLLSQVLVRADDHRIFQALLGALSKTGYVYYRSVPLSFINELTGACADAGLPLSSLLSGNAADDQDKPWLFFQTGADRGFILRQAQAAKGLMSDLDCAADASGDGPSAALASRGKSLCQSTGLKEKIRTAQASTESAPLLVELKDPCRGLPRAAAGAALASAIMKTEPACVPWYRGYANSLLSNGGAPCWMTGDDIITLLWLRAGIQTLERIIQDPEKLSRINTLFRGFGKVRKYAPVTPQIYRMSLQSPFPFEPKGFFGKRGLTYVLRKNGGGYTLDFTKQALKKNLISVCEYAVSLDSGTNLDLTVSRKFNAEEFAKEAFGLKKSNQWVRIRIAAKFFEENAVKE